MTRVFYTRMSVTEQTDPALYNYWMELVPTVISDKIIKYRRWQDAQACLFGKILLLQCFQRFYPSCTLNDLKYSAYQRPYINQPIDFNISHSGEYIVCVVSDECRVGIDVEEMKVIDYDVYSTQFTDEEWGLISSSGDSKRAFYRIWTQKEALIKANGKGLSIPLKSVQISDTTAVVENMKWFLTELPLSKQYSCHLATDKPIADTIFLTYEAIAVNPMILQ